MDHDPQDTRPLGPTGKGDGSSPPLREFSPEDQSLENAPWTNFLARILRPASASPATRRRSLSE
jgi:hypothetical protein